MKMPFPTFTVLQNKIVKVTEITVTIPMYNDGDEIIFSSKNSELIYLFIHEAALRQGLSMEQWDYMLLELCTNEKNNKKNDVLRFEDYIFYRASYVVKKFLRCKAKEIALYQFEQFEHLDEKKRGSKDYRYKEYQSLKNFTHYNFKKDYQL